MYTMATSTSWFGARTVVAAVLLLAVSSFCLVQAQDGCRVECYPNTKVINGKGALGKGDNNCRWILRTDGKAARLCDHIKCKKVCPSGQQQQQQQQQDQQEAASGDSMRVEQQLESDSPVQPAAGESMGIMRQTHGNKIAKAPVPGVQGGRLASGTGVQQPAQPQSASGRRMAPTLPPAVQYDDRDTPPPISRFLDISPEE